MATSQQWTRRQWLGASALGLGTGWAIAPRGVAAEPARKPALVAITLDLEMSRNFPQWEATHWDYEKGNLNPETKQYSLEAARRVRAAGGIIHFFAVGRVFEQADVTWLKEIAAAGHPIGNHTYDHINVTATRVEQLQYRFQRAPWLLRGLSVQEAIRENIILTNQAMKARLGMLPDGFRTPGGFQGGLREQPAVRALLRDLGYKWISSHYPAHPLSVPRQEPDDKVLDGIVAALPLAQPFTYPDGLVEVPMSPISDISAFRGGRWQLEWFLKAVRRSMEWTIQHGAVFDFLAHPSCLYVVDPEFRALDLICKMVRAAGERAAIVDLGTIARRATPYQAR